MATAAGRCLCGNVTYEFEAEPLATLLCHCHICQRQSGSFGSVNLLISRDTFQVVGESLAKFETTSDSGNSRDRIFCSNCGSPIATYFPEAPGLAALKAGTLDDVSQVVPTLEIWCESAQPWAFANDERVRMPKASS